MSFGQPFLCNQSKNPSSNSDKQATSHNNKYYDEKQIKDEETAFTKVPHRLGRRHSDPGPRLLTLIESHWPTDNLDNYGTEIQYLKQCCNDESQTIRYELEKDETLSHLLQEIRNLRQINRKLSVELFHTKMLLQIAEQNNHYPSEPGSASALVRKLIDAHNSKYDFQNRTPSSRGTLLKLSTSPKPFAYDDQNSLQREYEGLKHKLRAMENRMKEYQYSQGGSLHQPKFRSNNGHMASSADCLSSTLASPSSSTLTSFEDMIPPLSMNGLDSEGGRPNWATTAWPRVPGFHSTRLNGAIGMENLNSSYVGPANFSHSHSSLEETRSMEACDARPSGKHFRSNLSSLI